VWCKAYPFIPGAPKAVPTFLGVDGGGSKTAFLLINEAGQVLARHMEGSAYHPEVGIEGVRTMFARGCTAAIGMAGLRLSDIDFAFVGIPAYGEDSRLQATLDGLPLGALPYERYRCGNDMVCAWAGSLAGDDGLNVVAGTGSIVFGEYQGRQARAGGWGELFSDEGSAHWIAREGLSLFSRMSDGREPRGPLYQQFREYFKLAEDLDVCAALYGADAMQRSQFSQLAKLVAAAALNGDVLARQIFARGADELAAMIDAVRHRLNIPDPHVLPVSYSGSVFQTPELCLEPLQQRLAKSPLAYELRAPRLPPDAGAALYAAKLNGSPLQTDGLQFLETQLR
jgi:N-acetylglucosamine kinase-like BadF-type ATPase